MCSLRSDQLDLFEPNKLIKVVPMIMKVCKF